MLCLQWTLKHLRSFKIYHEIKCWWFYFSFDIQTSFLKLYQSFVQTQLTWLKLMFSSSISVQPSLILLIHNTEAELLFLKQHRFHDKVRLLEICFMKTSNHRTCLLLEIFIAALTFKRQHYGQNKPIRFCFWHRWMPSEPLHELLQTWLCYSYSSHRAILNLNVFSKKLSNTTTSVNPDFYNLHDNRT